MSDAARNMPQPLEGVLETSIYVDDLDVAREFYGGILGLEEILASENTFVFFRCATTIVLIFNPEETRKQPHAPPALPIPGHGGKGAGHICFRTPGKKLDQWKNRLIEQGIDIETEITWSGGARSVYFRDPAGNSLEFAEPKLWGYMEKETPA